MGLESEWIAWILTLHLTTTFDLFAAVTAPN
jgi:hypothetical protein